MKHSWLSLLIIAAVLPAYGQTYELSGLQGLKDERGVVYLEYRGYDVTISTMVQRIASEAKTIESAKQRFGLEHIDAEYHAPHIRDCHVIEGQETVSEEPLVQMSEAVYLLTPDSVMPVALYFQTLNQRDFVLEQELVNAYIEKRLDSHISDHWSADMITFAGRDIPLGNACGWEGPHHLHCRGGVIRWSEFPSYQEARFDINNRIDAQNATSGDILLEEDLPVVFEGDTVLAYRIAYNEQEGVLANYYVAARVRGRYISCVLSNWVYNAYDYELAPLLRELMTIPTLPDRAYNIYNDDEATWPEEEEAPEQPDPDRIYSFEIQAGSWAALGNLAHIYGAAPGVGAYFGFPVGRQLALDFGFQLAGAVNRNYFTYYVNRQPYDTRARMLVGFHIKLRKQQKIAPNTFLNYYVGAGVNTLETSLEDYYDAEKNTTVYHSLTTLDLLGGINLRYRHVGIFTEFHYTPYSISNKIDNGFGSTALNLGLMFVF